MGLQVYAGLCLGVMRAFKALVELQTVIASTQYDQSQVWMQTAFSFEEYSFQQTKQNPHRHAICQRPLVSRWQMPLLAFQSLLHLPVPILEEALVI